MTPHSKVSRISSRIFERNGAGSAPSLSRFHASWCRQHMQSHQTEILLAKDDEVELYVKSCVTCGGCKQPHHYLKAPLRHVIAYEFNSSVSIDHIVPSKEGATKR